MDESHAIIFDEIRYEMLPHFELDDELFAELRSKKIFPHSYCDYLMSLNFDDKDKKLRLIMDLKRRRNSYKVFSDILKRRSDGTFRLLEERASVLKPFYETKHKLCVIINNETFEDSELTNREGSIDDALKLVKTFENLNYKVQLHSNFSKPMFTELLDQIKSDCALNEDEEKYSEFDLFVLIVMSHGNTQGVITTDGQVISYKHILDHFTEHNCCHYHRKPKVFIFNCCRVENENSDPELREKGRTSPEDTFVLFSTLDNAESWRDPKLGTLFTNALSESLEQNRDREIGQIIRTANQKLKQKVEDAKRSKDLEPKAKQQLELRMLGTHYELRF